MKGRKNTEKKEREKKQKINKESKRRQYKVSGRKGREEMRKDINK